jgi:photosystem II stability/assembly factor-like uncharacterized protein
MNKRQRHLKRHIEQGRDVLPDDDAERPPSIWRRAIALIVAMLFSVIGMSQDWSPMVSGTSEDLNFIENGSFSDCWVVGDGGFVATSADCTTFSPVNVSAGSADLISLKRSTSVNIWVAGEMGVVRRQLGASWVVRDIPGAGATGERFFLFSRSSDYMMAVGDQGSVFRNLTGTAGGWEPRTSAGVPLYGGYGFVAATSHVVGAGGLILETPDGGLTWVQRPSGTTADLFAFVPGPFGSQLIVGDQGTILKSTDGGLTWESKPSNTSVALRALSTSGQNANYMLAVGDGGVVLRSIDGGESWCFLHATTSNLSGVEMVTNTVALVVGENGLILRTENGGGDCQTAPLTLLFADGFETGDTSRWSASTP